MPDPSPPHLSLVIPVYNGAQRLPESLGTVAAFLEEQLYQSELIVVDDHSSDSTERIIDEFVATRPCTKVIRNDRNEGKGASVRRGMLAARGRHRIFTDADLAYPPSEINKILRELERGTDVAIACRVLPESRYVMSPAFFQYLYTRHLMSRAFNLAVRALLLRDVIDSQAGLKGFSAAAAETVFPRVTIPRFGFDVEALFIAQKHGLAVREMAVNFRYDEEPTTVKFARAGARMIVDLARVRINDWRGRYD